MSLLIARDIRKTYPGGDLPVDAVRGVSFSLQAGEFSAVMGPSGCGKSTLLHICGAMDRPTAGGLEIAGISLASLEEDRLTRIRRKHVGFVFQFFNLLPTLTVAENIALPLLLAGGAPEAADKRACALAERVGIGHRTRHFPQQLSGGEAQRTAIARAVVHSPSLLIADEPTGNLDSDNGALIIELLEQLNLETRVTILLATHEPEVAAAAHRVFRMRDGLFEGEEHRRPIPGIERETVAPL